MSAATDACQRLRAERDELRAKVRAVEALADEWDEKRGGVVLAQCLIELRAVLGDLA